MPKKDFKPPPPSVPGKLKFHNRLTPEMAERHAQNVKMRNGRVEAEKAAIHCTEYDITVGHAAKQIPHAKAEALRTAAAKNYQAFHGKPQKNHYLLDEQALKFF